MLDGYLVLAVTYVLLASVSSQSSRVAPHIIVILADDLGWNDVSFHGSDQIPTPNIDALAYNGVILNSHYTPSLCTPSRSAFMTGKYPIHTGMQHLVVLEAEPWGLPLEEKLLPEYLRSVGYRTHAVGKWHLGFFKKEYTPLFRGFDSHLGYYQGFQDYFSHSAKATYQPYEGYDMRRNLDVDWSSKGRYSTDVFTEEAVKLIASHDTAFPLFLYLSHLAPHAGTTREPFQAPDEEIAKFSYIRDPERRVYAAMVSRLDHSVGEVVAGLRAKGMLNNSIIVFMSDNGAPTHGIHSNRGSNHPLRGIKETPWEGGVRTTAAIWSPLISRRQRISSQLMYMTDWLPTLYSAAGQNVSDLGMIDGVDMWQALATDSPSPRTQLVHNIDDIGDVYAALRKGHWKYVKGNVHKGIGDEWYGETSEDEAVQYDITAVLRSAAGSSIAGLTTRRQIKDKYRTNSTDKGDQWTLLDERTVLTLRRNARVSCDSPYRECAATVDPCLFNIVEDPCERNNLARHRTDVLAEMEELLGRYRQTMVPANNKPTDTMADPALWNNTWRSWQDPPEVGSRLLLQLLTVTIILVSLVCLVTTVFRHSSPFTLLPTSSAPTTRLDVPHLEPEKTVLNIDSHNY